MVSSSLIAAAAFAALNTCPSSLAFQLVPNTTISRLQSRKNMALSSSTSTTAAPTTSNNENTSKTHLYVPSERDERYQGNIARYLLDLHDEGATFDFCGGEYYFSDALLHRLQNVLCFMHFVRAYADIII